MLAADLGRSKLRVALFDQDGTMLQKSVVPTSKDEPLALVGAMNAIRAGAKIDIWSAVVGVPGPVSYGDGTVARLPNLPGWEEHVFAKRLTAEVGLPVRIANDADLAALGGAPLWGGAGHVGYGVRHLQHGCRGGRDHRWPPRARAAIARRARPHHH